MSHLAVKIVADWLASPTEGVLANAAALPYDTGDVPLADVHVYDELRTKWLARLMNPNPDSAGDQLVTPAVLVCLQDETPGAGISEATPQGNVATGELTLAVICVIRDADSAKAVTDLTYLLRATRNALWNLDAPKNQAARTRCGVRLEASTTVRLTRVADAQDDTLVGVVMILTYPTTETTTVA